MKRLAAALAVALIALAAVVSPASAAPGRLGLSWDGQAWSPTLSGTLFARAGSPSTWIPGDTDTQTFYVGNRSGDDATLAVQYLLPPSTLPSARDLQLSVRVGGGAWHSLAPGADWTNVQVSGLAAGRSTAVSVRGILDWAAPNTSQNQTAPVDFRVQLASIEADTSAGSNGGSGGQGSGDPDADHADAGHAAGGLAATGAPELRWLVGLSIVCLVGGLLIVGAARRKEERDAETS